MDAYEVLKPLGRGSYAVVHLVRRRDTNELFVIKRFHVPMLELTPKERQEIANEIRLLAHLKHPNIVQFVDNFVDNGVVHIVMEFASGGTLHKKIINRSGELFPEDTIWEMFVQVVMALKYVHGRSILHRDLKTENIMMSGLEERMIKLGDFGIAKVLGSQADMAATIVGTPHTLSPELVQGQPYDQKSDVWALGCVLYEMCALRKPFDASNMPAIIFSIMRNKPQPIPDEFSDDMKKMVKTLLSANPMERPSLTEIEAMPIVQAKMAKWREDYRKLETDAGVAASALSVPAGAASTARGSMTLTGKSPVPGTGGPDWSSSTMSMSSTMQSGGSTTASTPMSGGAMMSPAAAKAATAAFEREMLRDIEAIEDETAEGLGTSVHAKIEAVQAKLEAGPPVSGRVWESLGRAWADSGQFSKAISAYRRSLRAKSSNASLVAMEQLGNLLVRRAQQVWSQARSGDPDGALKAAQEALAGGSASALLQRVTVKQARAPVGKTAPRARRVSGITGTVEAEEPGADDDVEVEEPAWHRAASALMYEGLAYIERMCSLGNTAERRSLLGSAYKRRAWTGLGESRKEDLIQAASNYAAAHEIEMEDGKENPSPYARLNQLTLEMLAGNGTAEEKESWLQGGREAEAWATIRKEEDPADVWLWVQAVDARCLRYLLDDTGVTGDEVASGYRDQFAFGANQRVKSSVVDQLSFLIEVLQGRVAEVQEEAQKKAEAAIRVRAASEAPIVQDADPAGGVPRRLSTAMLAAIPDTSELMRVRDWLMHVLAKVQDLKKRLERHAGGEAAPMVKSEAAVIVPPIPLPSQNPIPGAAAQTSAGVLDAISPRGSAAFSHGHGAGTHGTPSTSLSHSHDAFTPNGTPDQKSTLKKEKRRSRDNLAATSQDSPDEEGGEKGVRRVSSRRHPHSGRHSARKRHSGDLETATPDAAQSTTQAGSPLRPPRRPSMPSSPLNDGNANPFARRSSNPFDSSRRKSVDKASSLATEGAGASEPSATHALQHSPAPTPTPSNMHPRAAGGVNPFARSTPAGSRFHSRRATLQAEASKRMVTTDDVRAVTEPASGIVTTSSNPAVVPSAGVQEVVDDDTPRDDEVHAIAQSGSKQQQSTKPADATKRNNKTQARLSAIPDMVLPNAIASPAGNTPSRLSNSSEFATGLTSGRSPSESSGGTRDSRKLQGLPALVITNGNLAPFNAASTLPLMTNKQTVVETGSSSVGANMSSAILSAAKSAIGTGAASQDGQQPSSGSTIKLEGPASISSDKFFLQPAQLAGHRKQSPYGSEGSLDGSRAASDAASTSSTGPIKPVGTVLDEIATPTGVSASMLPSTRGFSPGTQRSFENGGGDGSSRHGVTPSQGKRSMGSPPIIPQANNSDMVAAMFGEHDPSAIMDSTQAGIISGQSTGQTTYRRTSRGAMSGCASVDQPRPGMEPHTSTAVGSTPAIAPVVPKQSWWCFKLCS